MARVNPDPYLVLGVPPTATQAEITHAYRSRLRAHHPDTRPSPSARTADDQLLQVLAAYALLRNPARRSDYHRRTADGAATAPQDRAASAAGDRPVAGPVSIPITYHRTNARITPVSPPPLWAGPVRRHR